MSLRASIVGLALGLALVLAPAAAVAGGGPAEAAEGAHGGGHKDPSKTFNYFDIGYNKKDVYGGKYGDGVQGPDDEPEEKMSAPFVLMLVNFGLLLILLAKLGGPAVRRMAETRSDQIKRALDEAGRLRQAAAEKLDEYSSKLSAAEAEMQAMLDNMRADAAAEKARILAAAEAQAQAMQRDAEQRIAAEIALARATLTREVAAAAAAAAEQLIRAKATPADHTRLVDSFVADVNRQGVA
ncbi:MAG: hypothetical protein HS111_32490 [Kofleriaceae bacterium]|nr:hypothetical protein [Kofleriaceae bacterium]MCL4226435.1 hypothetical protein [Myxococcales bacterium]